MRGILEKLVARVGEVAHSNREEIWYTAMIERVISHVDVSTPSKAEGKGIVLH